MTTNYNWHIKSFGLLLCLIAVNAVRVQQQPAAPQQAKVTRGKFTRLLRIQ